MWTTSHDLGRTVDTEFKTIRMLWAMDGRGWVGGGGWTTEVEDLYTSEGAKREKSSKSVYLFETVCTL